MMQPRGLLAVLLCIAAAQALSSCTFSWPYAPAAANVSRVNAWTVPGVLRIETTFVPDTLNPVTGQESIDTDVSMFWAGHLFNWSDQRQLVPELATEVPTVGNGGISRDGRTIVYHLRRGVTWQDGAPFDASDILFTWRAIMNPRNDIPVRQGYDEIQRIDTPDRYTLVVHLRRPYAPFVTTFFSMSSTSYAVLPRHVLAQRSSIDDPNFDRLPIGTGPFRVVENDATHVRLVANPHYWRGSPKLNEVDFRWQPNGEKVLADLKAHRIDFYYGAYENQEPSLHGILGTTIYLYPFNSFTDIGFNVTSPLVSDKRVRQALASAIDRSSLLTRIGNGVNVSSDTDQAPFSWARDRDVKKYRFDPAAARALLSAAGWAPGADGIRRKNGRSLRLTLDTEYTSSGYLERQILHDWRAVGVDAVVHIVKAEQLDAPAAQGGIEARGAFDVLLEGWANGVDPDDSTQFECAMQPPAGWNIYRYCNPALDAAEESELSTYDQRARRADFARIQQILAEDVPIIVLSFQQQQDVVNIDLRNYRPTTAVTPFWNPWQLSI